jgi:hypothetical protein
MSAPALNGQFAAGAVASRASTVALQAQTRSYLALRGVGEGAGSVYARAYIGTAEAVLAAESVTAVGGALTYGLGFRDGYMNQYLGVSWRPCK